MTAAASFVCVFRCSRRIDSGTSVFASRCLSLGCSPPQQRVSQSLLSTLRNTSEIFVSPWDRIPVDIEEKVVKFSRKEPTPASLQMLMQTGLGRGALGQPNETYKNNNNIQNKRDFVHWGRFGQRLTGERILIQMANYLRQELPVRLSHRILDLDQVPFMRDMEAVQTVKGIYITSFCEITEFQSQIINMEDEHRFADLLTNLYQKHASVLVQMATGAYQLREVQQQQLQRMQPRYSPILSRPTYLGRRTNDRPIKVATESLCEADEVAFERMEGCHRFLDRFYMSRIGIRFLAGQYLSLRQQAMDRNHLPYSSSSSCSPESGLYIGIICQQTSPYECVRQATNDASLMCRRTYGRCPMVDIRGRTDLTFPYIPAYLHYILLELIKNAMRATMDRHLHSSAIPPIEVVIADGTNNEDVVIKIQDEGGGIPRSQVDKIWSYLFTTADKKVQQNMIGKSSGNRKDHSNESPLAGLGYGLPISRSYCRYFGGDLDLISMEGYGTDAFVHLKRLGDSKEPVPV